MSSPSADSSLLGHRSFVFFWFARVASTIAYQMLAVAVGWQIYALTRNPFDLGLVGLMQFVPVVGLVLVVGHVADRYDRRTIIRISQLVEALGATALAIGSAGGWLGKDSILAIIFVIGMARAFDLPTMHALVPGLVPQALVPQAIAGSASANQTAIIAGPALGGLLYLAGPTVAYTVSSTIFIGAGILITLIRAAPVPPRDPPTLGAVFAGFAFVCRRPAVLGLILLDLFVTLLGGSIALLPVYAHDILQTGPWGLGLLRSAPAVGALSTAIVLAHYPLTRRVGPIMFAAVATFGLATMVFGISKTLLLSLPALAVLGAADSISVVIRMSLVQLQTPDDMRGRVNTINSMFTGTSNTLGEFESGATAAWLGAVPAVLIGGFGAVLVALVWMIAFPVLRRIDRFQSLPESSA